TSGRYRTRPPILMKAGPSPVQRQRSSVRGLIFHRAASSTWLRCVTDIVVSFAIGRMPAKDDGGAPRRAAGGAKEERREECKSRRPKTKKAAPKDGLSRHPFAVSLRSSNSRRFRR